mgnify:CR=1 FL=1
MSIAIEDSSIDFSTSSAPDIALVENHTDSEKNVARDTRIRARNLERDWDSG